MGQGLADYSIKLKVYLVQARPRGLLWEEKRGDEGGECCLLLGEGAGRRRAAGLLQKTSPANHTTKMRQEEPFSSKISWVGHENL